MDRVQIEKIDRLRSRGYGYRSIAVELQLPVNTVKSWCCRHPVGGIKKTKCLCCHQPIEQPQGKRTKKFCSDGCRYQWWNSHPEARNPKKVYTHQCAFCGKEFVTMRANSRFCCGECLSGSRRKERENG